MSYNPTISIPYDPDVHPLPSKEYQGEKVKDTESFISRCEWTHGIGRFDYSKVNYVKSNQKITVICHGGPRHSTPHEMYVRPNCILSGRGCPKCSGKHRWTTDEWIEEASRKWDGVFDYSEVEYIGAFTKVWIAHKECGNRFSVTPDNHMRGKGCPSCKKGKPKRFEDTEDYISELIRIQGEDRFDTSQVVIHNSKTDIKLKCNIHDVWFYTGPHRMLVAGTEGCPKCSRARKSREIWISSAKETHPDREYDYSYVTENPSGKQKIYCPTHDYDFFLTYSEHILWSTKCKYCAFQDNVGGYQLDDLGNHDPLSMAFIYNVKITNKETGHSFRKVGVTKQSRVNSRFCSGSFKQMYDVEVIDQYQTTLQNALEQEHKIMESLHITGYRYLEHEIRGNNIGGWTECYREKDEVAKDIVKEHFKEIVCE